MASCSINAQNGRNSLLATEMSKYIKDASKLQTTYAKTQLDTFKGWYGDGNKDDNDEPILEKSKGSKPAFVNEKGAKLELNALEGLYNEETLPAVIEENQPILSQAVAKIAKIMQNKKAIIERKNIKSDKGTKAIEKIDRVLMDLDVKDETTSKIAILNYFNYALNEADKTMTRVEAIVKNGESLDNFSYALDYVTAFGNVSELFDMIANTEFADGENPFTKEFYKEVVSPIIGHISRIKNIYRTYAADKLGELLFKMNQNSNLKLDDIKKALFGVTNDISYTQYIADAMATSPDTVLALVDRLVKQVRNEINSDMSIFKNTILKTALLELETEQSSAGVDVYNQAELYDFMLVKDKNGKLTGEYKTPEMLQQEGLDVNSAKYKFVVMFNDNYQKAQSSLPEMFRKRNQLITILKSGEERVREKGVLKGTKDNIKESLTVTADETNRGAWEVYTDENDNEVKFIPVHYTATIGNKENQVSPDDVSLNMANSLQMFMTMTSNHNKMMEIVPYLEAAKNLLSERTVDTQKAGKSVISKGLSKLGLNLAVATKGVETNSYKMLVEYLDAHVYGEYVIPMGELSVFGYTVDKDKLMQAAMSYTAVNSLSFNLFSGLNNLVMGNIMNGLEANSGMFFNKSEFNAARLEYFKQLPAIMKDVSGRFVESDLGLFMEQFDIYQEFNEFGEPMESKSALYRAGSKTLDWMLKSGEHFIQTTHAISFMKSHKISDGKLLSYFEWLEDKNLENNKDNRKKFDELKDVYTSFKKNADGSINIDGVSKDEIYSFVERIKGNYQWNHGNYAKQDYTALNRRWYGKLLLLFRKWLKPGWNRRFSKEFYDQRQRSEMAGNYTVTASFMKSLFKDVKSVMMGLTFYSKTSQFKALPEWKKAQVIKTYREIYLVAGLIILSSFLMGLEADVPEEDRTWILNMSEFLARRVNSEMQFFVNPKEAMRVLKSPTATMTTVDKIMDVFQSLVTMDVYKSGENKGDYKVGHQATDLFPVYNKIKELWEVDEILKFQRQ